MAEQRLETAASAEGHRTDRKPYAVRLKRGHPTGTYHRAGLSFSAKKETELDEIPEAVAADPWLEVVRSPGMAKGKKR